MRQRSTSRGKGDRPLVGIVVDCADAYGRAILRGVASYANMQRRWLLFKDLDSVLKASGQWPELDGAVFAAVDPSVLKYGQQFCRHSVYCSGAGDPDVCPVIALDDTAAGEQAAEHLLDCRLEHFAFHGRYPRYTVSDRRFDGFRKAIEKRGFHCDEGLIRRATAEDRISHAHRPALIDWLRALPKPVGILAFDDTAAQDLAEACLEADLGVPDHVAIIGINNDELLCETAWPPLTSVEADFSRMGYLSARLLDRLLSGEALKPQDRLHLLPPLGVSKRQSTSTLAVKDQNLADAIRFIREHACDPCSVADVLNEVPIGRRWLERQFMAHLGRSPHDEITRVRIDVAQRLLKQSDLSLFEISSRCGFASAKSFYTAYRQITGGTPAAFRRSVQRQDHRSQKRPT